MDSAPHPAVPLSSFPLRSNGQPEYYSIAQAAELLGVSRVSIWRWIRDGQLPAFRVGPRTTRIKRADLERYMFERGTINSFQWISGSPGAVTASTDTTTDGLQPDWREIDPFEHFAQFYDAEGSLMDAVAGFIGAALRSGDVGIIIATPAHREGIERRLGANGLDVDVARRHGLYVALDAAHTLSDITVQGSPDPERFAEIIGRLIAQSRAGGHRVRAFGEMVALLALEGNHAGALELESLWNELQTQHGFALFCGYPMSCLSGSAFSGVLREVCAQHARVIPTESYTALPTPDDRSRAIVHWQQQAQSLEAALAAERAARRAAEEALHVRDEFLSIASHELKTPLATLSGHVQVVLRRLERDDPAKLERSLQSLRVIKKQTGKLALLITQLLDASRLDAGKLVLEREPTDLVALVEQVVADARVLSELHPITVVTPPTLVALVDPLRLEQVLSNLLTNAIKYDPSGGQVEVALVRRASNMGELTVRDHGPGIPAEKREQLFQRFYQAQPDYQKQGLGLGLYISRQIVELHGGCIHAEFPPDGGTCLIVRLPIQ